MIFILIILLTLPFTGLIIYFIDNYFTYKKIRYLFMEVSEEDPYFDTEKIIKKASKDKNAIFKFNNNSFYLKNKIEFIKFISLDSIDKSQQKNINWYIVDSSIAFENVKIKRYIVIKDTKNNLYYLAKKIDYNKAALEQRNKTIITLVETNDPIDNRNIFDLKRYSYIGRIIGQDN